MRKNFALAFGALYMLFFTIPFPMLIYYSVNSEFDVTTLKDKNPWLALAIVSISIILWLIVLIGYFHKWILQIFISKRNIEKLKSGGVSREAKILSAVKTSKPMKNSIPMNLNYHLKIWPIQKLQARPLLRMQNLINVVLKREKN